MSNIAYFRINNLRGTQIITFKINSVRPIGQQKQHYYDKSKDNQEVRRQNSSDTSK